MRIVITGGDGDDYIYNNGYNSTINAGAGINSISNSASNVLFQYGGGSDIITGFDSSSTLQISGDSITGTEFIGTDAILKVGTGSITLKNVKPTCSAYFSFMNIIMMWDFYISHSKQLSNCLNVLYNIRKNTIVVIYDIIKSPIA